MNEPTAPVLTLGALNARFDALYALFRRVLFWATVIGVGFAIAVGVFLLAAQRTGNEAQEAVKQLTVQRTEARIQTCKKDLKFANAHNRLVERDKGLVLAIATAGGQRPIPPDVQPIVDAELAQYDQNLVEVPDCSPAGIKAFYEGDKP